MKPADLDYAKRGVTQRRSVRWQHIVSMCSLLSLPTIIACTLMLGLMAHSGPEWAFWAALLLVGSAFLMAVLCVVWCIVIGVSGKQLSKLDISAVVAGMLSIALVSGIYIADLFL